MHYTHYYNYTSYTNYIHYFYSTNYINHTNYVISQLFIDLGITDHVWQEKWDAIAKTVDALGDEFQPAMRAGWLAYIRKTYPDGAAAAVDAIGEGTLVLDYD
jgi:hypothetical protein